MPTVNYANVQGSTWFFVNQSRAQIRKIIGEGPAILTAQDGTVFTGEGEPKPQITTPAGRDRNFYAAHHPTTKAYALLIGWSYTDAVRQWADKGWQLHCFRRGIFGDVCRVRRAA